MTVISKVWGDSMLKIIGCIFAFMASGALGCYFSFKPFFRVSDLQMMLSAMSVLKSELEFSGSSLSEAALAAAERTAEPISKIFTDFSAALNEKNGQEVDEIWKKSCSGNIKGLYFAAEDIECLYNFGRILSCPDIELQKRNIALLMNYFEEKAKQVYEIGGKNKRVYQSIGFLGGLMLITVLI